VYDRGGKVNCVVYIFVNIKLSEPCCMRTRCALEVSSKGSRPYCCGVYPPCQDGKTDEATTSKEVRELVDKADKGGDGVDKEGGRSISEVEGTV